MSQIRLQAFTVIAALLMACVLTARGANASAADQQSDANICARYGGYASWTYSPSRQSLGYCQSSGNCLNCIQYCYWRQIVCRNGQQINVFSQLKPYVSEAEQSAEWAQIQAQEGHDNAQFAALASWNKLSPWPQLLIFALSIGFTMIARKGLKDNDWRLAPLYQFNLYLAVSLLFFNTTAKGSNSFIYSLDQWVFFHSWLFFGATVAVIVIEAVPFMSGWDYYFIKHPATDIVNSAVNHDTPIDRQALVQALKTAPEELRDLKPAYHYKHQAEKARKLSEKLERDAELARAASARERARAELRDEQQLSAEEKRERVWRGRTFQ